MRQHPDGGRARCSPTSSSRGTSRRWCAATTSAGTGRAIRTGWRARTIPLAARILCIADVYDALTTERSYKRAVLAPRGDGDHAPRGRASSSIRSCSRSSRSWCVAARVNAPAAHRERMPAARRAARRRGDGHPRRTTSRARSCGARSSTSRRPCSPSAAAPARTVSLLVIDVDQFKSVNDTYGHLTGDDALRIVAGVIREQLRPGQYVGRYAGDEFVVLLPGLDAEAARAIAEQIRRTTGGDARSRCASEPEPDDARDALDRRRDGAGARRIVRGAVHRRRPRAVRRQARGARQGGARRRGARRRRRSSSFTRFVGRARRGALARDARSTRACRARRRCAS